MSGRQSIAFDAGQHAHIALVDHTSEPLGVSLTALRAAMQKFLRDFFVPVWGTPAELSIAQEIPDDAWAIVFLDDHTSATDLGVHDVTHGGRPMSRVFVNEVHRIGDSVSATACHELVEMLVDPAFNLCAEAADGTLYAYEVADPCEDDLFDVNGIAMSDFVYPSWFEHFHKPHSTRFDHLGLIHAPFELRPTGYISVRTAHAWHERHGSPAKKSKMTLEDRDGHRSAMRNQRTVRQSISPAEREERRRRVAARVGQIDRRHESREAAEKSDVRHETR